MRTPPKQDATAAGATAGGARLRLPAGLRISPVSHRARQVAPLRYQRPGTPPAPDQSGHEPPNCRRLLHAGLHPQDAPQGKLHDHGRRRMRSHAAAAAAIAAPASTRAPDNRWGQPVTSTPSSRGIDRMLKLSERLADNAHRPIATASRTIQCPGGIARTRRLTAQRSAQGWAARGPRPDRGAPALERENAVIRWVHEASPPATHDGRWHRGSAATGPQTSARGIVTRRAQTRPAGLRARERIETGPGRPAGRGSPIASLHGVTITDAGAGPRGA